MFLQEKKKELYHPLSSLLVKRGSNEKRLVRKDVILNTFPSANEVKWEKRKWSAKIELTETKIIYTTPYLTLKLT